MPLIPRRPNDPGYGPLGNIVALAENRAIGTSSADAGVLGASNTAAGVYGYSLGPPSAPGAAPQETGMSDGVLGVGKNGVHGQSTSGNGVLGESASGAGVLGSSTSGFGIEPATGRYLQKEPSLGRRSYKEMSQLRAMSAY